VDTAQPVVVAGETSGRQRHLPAAALVAVTVVTVVVSVAAVVMAVVNRAVTVPPSPVDLDEMLGQRWFVAVKIAAAVLFAGAGWLLASRRPDAPMGYLCLVAGLANALGALSGEWAVYAQLGGHRVALGAVALWLGSWLYSIEPAVLVSLYLFFPDGHLPRPPALWLSGGAVVLCACGIVGSVVAPLHPDPNGPFAGLGNPLGGAAFDGFDALLGIGLILGSGMLVVRWFSSRGHVRRAFRALAVIALVGFVLPLLPVDTQTARVLYEIHTILLLLVIVTSVLRHQLYGIDLVLNRTLVYVILSIMVAGVYAVLVGLGVAVAGTLNPTLTPMAAVLAAMCLFPARERVQRLVNRFLYGRRDEPFAVITRIGGHLETSADPGQLLEGLLQAVVDELRVPAAELVIAVPEDGTSTITVGRMGTDADHFPLTYQSATIGELAVTRRPGQHALPADEARLLGQVARQSAVAAQSVILWEQLTRSRVRVVGAAEEERRRLRRDLHDGLGPLLTAAATRIDACRNLLTRDVTQVNSLLDDVRVDLTQGLADLRRLVYSLRPPVLDELGLGRGRRADLPALGVACRHGSTHRNSGSPRRRRNHGLSDHRGSHHERGAACGCVPLHRENDRDAQARSGYLRRRPVPGTVAARSRADVDAGTYRGPGRQLVGRPPPRWWWSRARRTPADPDRGDIMTDPKPLRVVVVDDHPIVRAGLRASLNSVDGFAVVGEAGSGEDAVEIVGAVHPDVVLMDIQMPGIGGLEATRRIYERHPDCAVLMLTMYGEDEFVIAALRAGARGYLLKGAQQADVIRTITAVANGDAVLGHDVAGRLLAVLSKPPAVVAPFPQLTVREREILGLLANGMTNGPIARRLNLSPRTVANHISNILTKIGVADRAQAVIAARQAGLADCET
jgi:DNA-binding NarL/FixJ family response regulator/signal transduction histidine kinase